MVFKILQRQNDVSALHSRRERGHREKRRHIQRQEQFGPRAPMNNLKLAPPEAEPVENHWELLFRGEVTEPIHRLLHDSKRLRSQTGETLTTGNMVVELWIHTANGCHYVDKPLSLETAALSAVPQNHFEVHGLQL